MLTNQTIQQVKELNIYDALKNYISLKKEGNLYKACCPIHNEKTPSFSVNSQKNFFKCFGCGVGGDAIEFVMLNFKLDFIGAVEKLAADNGIAIEYKQFSEEEKEAYEKEKSEKEKLLQATAYAQKYFAKSLDKEINTDTYNYALSRMSEESITKFKIGFAPSNNHIKGIAEAKGKLEVFFNAGLLSKNESNGTHYDKFQNRLIFPIINHRNETISFGARVLDDSKPKYLNGPETKIYDKSKILYGLREYKSIPTANFSILVEGYLDVIALHDKAITNVLATCGTALSNEQAKILGRLNESVVLMRDCDTAGIKATLKDIDVFLINEIEVFVCELPADKDPDDLAKQYNEDDLLDYINLNLINGVEWKAKQILAEANTPAKITKAHKAIAEMILLCSDEDLQKNYIEFIANCLNLDLKKFSLLFGKVEKAKINSKKEFLYKKNDDIFPKWFSEEDKKHWNTFHFAIRKNANEKTGMYFPDKSWKAKQETNFIINPLYTIRSSTDPRRMVEVIGFNNYTNQIIEEVMYIDANEILKLEQFKSKMIKQKPFITFSGFGNPELDKLKMKLLPRFVDCFELSTLGYQPEQFWAFSNICFQFPNKENPKGKEVEYNEYGVVEINNQGFLSEAKNKRIKEFRPDEKNPYEEDLYFIYVKSPINFNEWSILMTETYEEKAWLGISFAIMTIFRDVILQHTKIPHLHCYGEKGSGKSDFAESIFYLFFAGKDSTETLYKVFNLSGGGTAYSFHNRLERFRNVAQILNEYDDTNILPEFFDAIKASFDGEGRTRGSGIKGKTETMKKNATLILVGQKIGNRDDNSVLTRSIIIPFLKVDNRSEKMVNAHRQLKDFEQQGLSSLILEILEYRSEFKKEFADLFLKEVTSLQKQIKEKFAKAEIRIIKSMTALKLAYEIMQPKLGLPAMPKNAPIEKLYEMHEHLQSTDGLNEFWNTIEFLLQNRQIENGWEFKIEALPNVSIKNKGIIPFQGEKRVLFIRLDILVKLYQIQFNKEEKKERPMNRASLLEYMKSQKQYFFGLISGKLFTSEKHNMKTNSSCYALDYDFMNKHYDLNLEVGANKEAEEEKPKPNDSPLFDDDKKDIF